MIDFHTHPVMVKELTDADEVLARNIHEVLGFHFPSQPLDCFLREMDEAGIEKAVILPLDCSTAHHCQIISNEQIADLAASTSRRLALLWSIPAREMRPSNSTCRPPDSGCRGCTWIRRFSVSIPTTRTMLTRSTRRARNWESRSSSSAV